MGRKSLEAEIATWDLKDLDPRIKKKVEESLQVLELKPSYRNGEPTDFYRINREVDPMEIIRRCSTLERNGGIIVESDELVRVLQMMRGNYIGVRTDRKGLYYTLKIYDRNVRGSKNGKRKIRYCSV